MFGKRERESVCVRRVWVRRIFLGYASSMDSWSKLRKLRWRKVCPGPRFSVFKNLGISWHYSHIDSL